MKYTRIFFKADHLEGFEYCETSAWQAPDMSLNSCIEAYRALETAGGCATLLLRGKPIFCCGVDNIWPERSFAWTLIHKDAGPHMVAITKMVKDMIKAADVTRIEAHVDNDFEQGHRWIKVLGFQFEGVMRKFTPTGSDVALYALVR